MVCIWTESKLDRDVTSGETKKRGDESLFDADGIQSKPIKEKEESSDRK
jgi:hypothetical protein